MTAPTPGRSGQPSSDVIDCGDDVVAFVRYRGRGTESGVEVEASMANVWTIRDGKAIRLRQFLDRGKALEAVGLSEEDLSE